MMHFPPFPETPGSGSGRTLWNLSIFKVSFVLVNSFLSREIFVGSNIRAAATGNSFENKDRSSMALDIRTIGGQNIEIVRCNESNNQV